MRRLLREPLLHFLLLGALLFGGYGLVRGGALKAPTEIVVSPGLVQSLQAQFVRARLRAPSPEEMQGLVDSWVREEIYYREGVAMGLDRDDPIVRRRVGQKLEFLIDRATPPPPTEAELQQWLATHADRYRVEPRYTLAQVYFDVPRHGDSLMADIATVRRALAAGKDAHGDATLLPPVLENAGASQVRKIFGTEFAAALEALPAGDWQGPVRSGFGVHLVKLGPGQAARPATREEARAEVERDFLAARAAEAGAANYRKLRAQYVVRNDAAAAAPAKQP